MKKQVHKFIITGGIFIAFCGLPKQLSAQVLAFAQSKPKVERAEIETTQIKLRDAILALKNQYGVDILFEEKILLGISVSQESLNSGQNLEKSLDNLLTPNGLTFKKVRKNTYLIIGKKQELSTQSKVLTSETNQPLSSEQNTLKEVENSASVSTDQTVTISIFSCFAPLLIQ